MFLFDLSLYEMISYINFIIILIQIDIQNFIHIKQIWIIMELL